MTPDARTIQEQDIKRLRALADGYTDQGQDVVPQELLAIADRYAALLAERDQLHASLTEAAKAFRAIYESRAQVDDELRMGLYGPGRA